MSRAEDVVLVSREYESATAFTEHDRTQFLHHSPETLSPGTTFIEKLRGLASVMAVEVVGKQ